MKLYVLAILLIALVACGAPSVSQDEVDALAHDHEQKAIEVSSLNVELKNE